MKWQSCEKEGVTTMAKFCENCGAALEEGCTLCPA